MVKSQYCLEKFKKLYLFILLASLALGCQKSILLEPVSVADFSKFISETAYITDAEKFGWSIIQEDVYNFRVDSFLTWQIPNGVDSARLDFPVTQVSFNDAIAYCKWANARLPSYDEFWKLTKNDRRVINQDSYKIVPINQTNVIGNVWDITTTENSNGFIRLAGGSFLCNPNSCNGTHPSRSLFVDKMTGNIHIGFSVIKE